ncbi:MAG: SOS response-associated peptidase [Pseudorhodoplanes sp.]|nr:SOS response-associated peptidase [Pseudorhodoplanes sp.]
MCGRYALISSPELIRRLLAYLDQPNFPPRYNIAPTQPVAIVRMVEGKRRFALVRWGLLPSWVKDPQTFTLLINARAETINDKPAFRSAMKRRRCLVPADGFYEWKAEGGRKRPYFVRLKSGGPFAFAGLWETWIGPNGEEMDSAVIVTAPANRLLAPVHERMPVILEPARHALWLDGDHVDQKAAAQLLVPAREDLLDLHEISTAVNRVANDGPELIAPLAGRDDRN